MSQVFFSFSTLPVSLVSVSFYSWVLLATSLPFNPADFLHHSFAAPAPHDCPSSHPQHRTTSAAPLGTPVPIAPSPSRLSPIPHLPRCPSGGCSGPRSPQGQDGDASMEIGPLPSRWGGPSHRLQLCSSLGPRRDQARDARRRRRRPRHRMGLFPFLPSNFGVSSS